MKYVRRVVPLLSFALALVALQWLGGHVDFWLPAKTLLAFLAATAAFALIPWPRIARAARPGSWLFTPLLFLLFIRHFVAIVGAEAMRLLHARSLSVPRPYGRGAFRSLVYAVAALFQRSITRAERFYAAQSLRGLAE